VPKEMKIFTSKIPIGYYRRKKRLGKKIHERIIKVEGIAGYL